MFLIPYEKLDTWMERELPVIALDVFGLRANVSLFVILPFFDLLLPIFIQVGLF